MNQFMIGCNYWASNAGMYMWRNFDEKIVESDFQQLKEHGANTVRIFPLWSDFQPVQSTNDESHTNCKAHELRTCDKPLKTPAGLDETQLENFGKVLDLAEKYGFQVIVSLITGWMSGRMFVPPFLEGKSPLTSPKAIVWECNFIREFIPRFKDRKCIVAWEPGNEVNCMDFIIDDEKAELWLSAITSTIRAADPTRPIYSGMHSLNCTNDWSIPMVSRYVDAQTTHPYPLFTPNCGNESILQMRAALHPAAESAYYAGISDQPCFVEEINVLGPMVLSDDYTPEFIEKTLYSSLQYGCTGYLWWCGFDQDKFDFAPYDNNALEQNLGLFRSDKTPKPVVKKMREIAETVQKLGELPPAKKDGVVILSRDYCNQADDWNTAYGAFCLAAQAGYTVDFCFEEQPLKDSDHYLLASILYNNGIPKKMLGELKEKVSAGAKLLITYGGGYVGDFENLTGLKVAGRERHAAIKTCTIGETKAELPVEVNLLLNASSAKALLRDDEGNILLSENAYGKGKVYFCTAPLELVYTKSYKPHDSALYEFYKLFFADTKQPISFQSKHLCVTYHGDTVLVTNFGETETPYRLQSGYNIKSLYGCSEQTGTIKFNETFAWLTLEKSV